MSASEQSAQSASQTDRLIGKTIGGKYTVLDRIGGGGMGAVYRAKHTLIDRTVALKILHRHLCESESDEFLERFKREATIASQIEHPNVITLYDFGLEDGSPYIVMQYAEGKTLKSLLLDEGPLDLERVDRIISQVCNALSQAHSSGIVHRDLKPDNLMVTEQSDGSDLVRVLDFGIAKPLGVFGGENNPSLTRTGSFMGTPTYMAPEQALEKGIDARCDIYSLGIILYEMISGDVPFESQSPMEVLLKHVHAAPIPIREFRPNIDVPPVVSDVVLKALAKDPDERFQSVEELAKAFHNAIATPSSLKTHHKSSHQPKVTPKNTAWVGVGSAVITALAVFGIAYAFMNSGTQSVEEQLTASETLVASESSSEASSTEPESVSKPEPVPASIEATTLTIPGDTPEPVENSQAPALATKGQILAVDASAPIAGRLFEAAKTKSLEAMATLQTSGTIEDSVSQSALPPADPEIEALSRAERRKRANDLHDQGRDLMKNKQYLDAGLLFKEALTYYDSHLASRLSLGVCLLRLGKAEHAKVQFERALELDKQYAPTYYNLASYYAVSNQPEQAIGELKKAIRLFPGIRKWLADDPDFENIRENEAFKALAQIQ